LLWFPFQKKFSSILIVEQRTEKQRTTSLDSLPDELLYLILVHAFSTGTHQSILHIELASLKFKNLCADERLWCLFAQTRFNIRCARGRGDERVLPEGYSNWRKFYIKMHEAEKERRANREALEAASAVPVTLFGSLKKRIQQFFTPASDSVSISSPTDFSHTYHIGWNTTTSSFEVR